MEIELNKYDKKAEPIVEFKSIDPYVFGLRKQEQIKLAVALDLAKQDLYER